MAMYAKVRRLRFRDGLSISEIARRTSLTRNTIKKWLVEPARSEMKYERPGGPHKLDAVDRQVDEQGSPLNLRNGAVGTDLLIPASCAMSSRWN
jgi:transposase-like protein